MFSKYRGFAEKSKQKRNCNFFLGGVMSHQWFKKVVDDLFFLSRDLFISI